MTFEIGQNRIEVSFRAKRSWLSMYANFRLFGRRWHRPDDHKHFVWGRLSIYVDQPDVTEIQVCSYCNAETQEMWAGDEGLTYCSEGCGCLEGQGGTKSITLREHEATGN